MQDYQEVGTGAFLLEGLSVEPATGRVKGPGGEVRLEPRVMSLLQMLAGKAGELVTRTELLASNWPGEGVYDEALTQCVYQLRHQLSQAGGGAEFRNLIKTVPKRGFVLIGEVSQAGTDSPLDKLPPLETKAAATPQKKNPILLRWPGLALACLVLLLALAWQFSEKPEPTPAAGASSQTIAVLPFLPLVAEHRDEPLELGMADSLITQLSTLPQIAVRPMNAVRRFGNLERDVLEIGKLLQADSVIDGTIQRLGDELRVTARLLRVADGQALWADSFNAPFSDVFSLQDEICEQIAAALTPQLKTDFVDSGSGGTSNTKAYELFLKGRYHSALLTRPDLLLGRDYFQQALVLDPDYALAWLGLAGVNLRLPLAGEEPPGDYYAQARVAALKALSVDNTLAEGHAFMGWVSFWSDHDWDTSEQHFKKAIQLNSNEFEAHAGYSHLLSNIGRHDEALSEIRRARQINPLFPMSAVMEAGYLHFAGQKDDALRMIEAAVRQNGQFWLARLLLAVYYEDAGRVEEALEQVMEARKLAPDSNYVTANQVGILVAAGRVEEANGLVAAMEHKASQEYVSPYYLALANVKADNTEQAIAWLRVAVAENNPMLVFLGVHSSWKSLRGMPEFEKIMQEVNLDGIDF